MQLRYVPSSQRPTSRPLIFYLLAPWAVLYFCLRRIWIPVLCVHVGQTGYISNITTFIPSNQRRSMLNAMPFEWPLQGRLERRRGSLRVQTASQNHLCSHSALNGTIK
jgi:hypothetical protein